MRLTDQILDLFSFGLDPDSELAARLRAHQIRTMVQITPLMMTANILNALVVVVALHGKTGSPFVYYWSAAIFAYAATGIFGWYRMRNQPKVIRASKRAFHKIVRRCGFLGLLWGVLPVVFYINGDTDTKLVVLAIIAGMLGGGAVTLYIIPQALFTYLAGLSAGCGYALLLSGSSGDLAVFALLAIYSGSLAKAGYTMASTFVGSKVSEIEVEEQAGTIQMLLNDFSESARDWLWETDAQGRFVRGGDQFEDHIGFAPVSLDPATGAIDIEFAVGPGEEHDLKKVWMFFQNRKSFKQVAFPVKEYNSGTLYWLALSGKPVFTEEGAFRGYRGVASDITALKQAEEQIEYLAYNDSLTGLTNRVNFKAALASACEKNTGDSWSVLYLDLDGFKPVNDRYGHGTGDRLLIEAARRMKEIVTDVDLVARLGGDEFAILARSAASEADVRGLAANLVGAISQPYEIDGNRLDISVSIGIAMASRCDPVPEQIIDNADLALYRAKAGGKSTYRLYEKEMDELIEKRQLLERELRSAVSNGDLKLNFLPWVDAETHRTAGFEALVRWRHPTMGTISPAEFIPIAEGVGLVQEIGDRVLADACNEAANWPEDMKLAVNVSSHQFRQDHIVDAVKWALDGSGLAPNRLELEITEGLFAENNEKILQTVRALRKLGVSIALDDFGSGTSSLSSLLKFPIDRIKIARSFITSDTGDETDSKALEMITGLGSAMELDVTIEGIEKPQHLETIGDLPCTHLQGFHFGMPLEPVELAAHMMNDVQDGLAQDIAKIDGARTLKTKVVAVTPKAAG